MLEVAKVLDKVRSTSSTNEKQRILIDNDSELLRNVLLYCYDGLRMYGVTNSSILIHHSNIVKNSHELFSICDKLAVSNINDQLRLEVNSWLSGIQNADVRQMCIGVLTKDLRLGIGSKSINKCFKGLIQEWNVQQAYPLDKYKMKKNEWFALLLKLNGIRSTLYRGEFKSRQNKPMNGFNHVVNDFEKLGIDLGKVVFDGEMIRKNTDNLPDNENFRLTTGIVNSDIANKTDVKYVIFDMLPTDEFNAGESKATYKQRLLELVALKHKIESLGLENIEVAPCYYCGTDITKVDEFLEYTEQQGLEGLMLLRNTRYKCKRHNGILKVKAFKTADCVILDFEEGEGRLKGTLGAILIGYKGFVVKVGSGYTDQQRAEIWANKQDYTGRILEVKYKEESKDKHGNVSLQFPTFVCIRNDKTEESYN